MTSARAARWAVVVALFCAGLVAAFATGNAAGELGSLTVTTATTTPETTDQQTVPQTTVIETVQQTVTNTHVITKVPSTATAEDASSGTQTWALVVIGIAIVGLIALIGWLASRHKDLPPEARRRVLADAVAAWVAQGWAPVSQTDSTAVLRRGEEHTVLSVDGRGNISSQPVGPPAQPS